MNEEKTYENDTALHFAYSHDTDYIFRFGRQRTAGNGRRMDADADSRSKAQRKVYHPVMPDRCPVGRSIIIHPARIGRKASDRSISNGVFAVYCIIVFPDMVFRRICGKFNFRRIAIFTVRPAKGLGNFLQRNIKSVVLNIRLACEFERFAVPVCRIFSGCQRQRPFAGRCRRCARTSRRKKCKLIS